jgi:hypothetical protein
MGEIAFMANALPDTPDFDTPEIARKHFMIRASTDEQGPIYLSKFGIIGPVVAHRFSTALNFYPFKSVGKASGFSVELTPPQ